MKNYKEKALRTELYDMDSIKKRLVNDDTIRLLHSAMGLSTEANEFLDMLKKHIYYGKDLDVVNAKEEISDTFWYCAVAIDVLQTTFEDVMNVNIEKLKIRYPEKFTEEKAINRNLKEERKILESK